MLTLESWLAQFLELLSNLVVHDVKLVVQWVDFMSFAIVVAHTVELLPF